MKYLLVPLFLSILFSCSEEVISDSETILELPTTPYEYLFDNNEATLGRVLFYDKSLSINNSISCASCHKQSIAFTDNNRFSSGFDNNKTHRNSMPIQNLSGNFFSNSGTIDSGGFSCCGSNLFWDGRAFSSPHSLLIPILNHIEMGIPDVDYLVKKVSSRPYYEDLFETAYGNSSIDETKIASALFAFTNSITSVNTKLDRSMFGSEVLTAKEKLGMQLFVEKYECNACHQVEDPQGYIFAGTFANIGLDSEYDDNGLGLVNEIESDNGKFKIPSLRNVMLTAPYMHDGRFETLEEVIEHYSTGLETHPNLDSRLASSTGAPMRFNITDTEVDAIIEFLGTLTDYEMITADKFSNPFKVK